MLKHLDLVCENRCSGNNCLTSIDIPLFFIIDKGGKSEICDTPLASCFHVVNSQNKKLNFLAIDECLLLSTHNQKRCDCALFDDEFFRFIELKNVKIGQKGKRRSKAMVQLKETVKLFFRHLPIENHILEAYVCVGFNKPRPRFTSTHAFHVKDFFDNYHNTHLYEGSEITI